MSASRKRKTAVPSVPAESSTALSTPGKENILHVIWTDEESSWRKPGLDEIYLDDVTGVEESHWYSGEAYSVSYKTKMGIDAKVRLFMDSIAFKYDGKKISNKKALLLLQNAVTNTAIEDLPEN